jgi:CheY-like chemotaxis protein
MDQYTQEQASVPQAFIKQVRDALEHLYDFPYLQCHPLAQEGELTSERSHEVPGQRLRRELMTTIEKLNPGPDASFRVPHARRYNLLLLHYVEGMTIQEAAHELSISRRQAHRDLRRGEETVAAVLWGRRPISPPQEPNAARLSSVEMEMARLETHACQTDMGSLIQRAHQAVAPLASKRAVELEVSVPSHPVTVSTDPVMARQVLVNMLSDAVRQAQMGTLSLTLIADEEQVFLTLHYTLQPGAVNTPVVNGVIAQLVKRLGWTARQEDRPGDIRTVVLYVTARCPTVLVIDDNEGLVQLLDDYLTGQACRILAATSAQEGLRLAQELVPDAIVLDVMMPEMDGWELLQRLQTYPQTATIPVIICSVINNPDLAYSLGATLFVPKPVRQADVLAVLHQLSVV